MSCWGSDTYGQVSDVPSGAFIKIATGGSHACGLRASGLLECWGSDGYSQSNPPDAVFEDVAAGAQHTCGISAVDQSMICFGAD